MPRDALLHTRPAVPREPAGTERVRLLPVSQRFPPAQPRGYWGHWASPAPVGTLGATALWTWDATGLARDAALVSLMSPTMEGWNEMVFIIPFNPNLLGFYGNLHGPFPCPLLEPVCAAARA